jgi:hypothetical protein
MGEGDKIRVKLDDGIYEYGEVISIAKGTVTYIEKHGIKKDMCIEFVEVIK